MLEKSYFFIVFPQTPHVETLIVLVKK